MVKALVIFLCISVLVLMAVVAYSLCVMAKDEDDAEQAKWLRELRKRNKKGEGWQEEGKLHSFPRRNCVLGRI